MRSIPENAHWNWDQTNIENYFQGIAEGKQLYMLLGPKKRVKEREKDIKKFFEKSLKLYQSKNYEKSALTFFTIVYLDKTQVKCWPYIAKSEFELAHYSRSTRAYLCASMAEPSNPLFHYMLWESLRRTGEEELAKEALNKSIAVSENNKNYEEVYSMAMKDKKNLENIDFRDEEKHIETPVIEDSYFLKSACTYLYFACGKEYLDRRKPSIEKNLNIKSRNLSKEDRKRLYKETLRSEKERLYQEIERGLGQELYRVQKGFEILMEPYIKK